MSEILKHCARIGVIRCKKTILPTLFIIITIFFLNVIFASLFSVKHLDRKYNSAFSALKRRIHGAQPIAGEMPKAHLSTQNAYKKIINSQRFKQMKREKSKMTAIAMDEQRMKLSPEQRTLIDEMTQVERDKLVNEFYKVRQKQEFLYVDQLRKNGLVEPIFGGGEKIIADRRTYIRFPTSLKSIYPKDWPSRHKIYLNITYSPWSTFQDKCQKLSISFSPPKSLKTTALASFPSSGNSWLRYLIECASGIFTGSLYKDSSLIRKGLFGEGVKFDSGMTLLQKTHGYTTGEAMNLNHSERLRRNHLNELNHRAVLIIRNPFKALISHRNLDMGGHTGNAPPSEFIGKGWKDFVKFKSNLWKEFYIDWLENSKREDICIVFYEEIEKNTTLVLKRVLDFLLRPIEKFRLDCIEEHTDLSFKRKPSTMQQYAEDPFKGELKGIIYQAIDEVNQVLLEKGHSKLPVSHYEFYDPIEAIISRQKSTQSHNYL